MAYAIILIKISYGTSNITILDTSVNYCCTVYHCCYDYVVMLKDTYAKCNLANWYGLCYNLVKIR